MDGKSFYRTFKTRFFTGVFITFPLVLTVLAVVWLFELLDGILGGVLDKLLGAHIPGLGFVLSIVGVFAVGILAATVIGRKFIGLTEAIMLRLPVIKSFYSTFKQLGDAFSPDNRAAFKEFVVVEYPSPGLHSFGFMTKECSIINREGETERYTTVYIPTNHIYLGDVVLFRAEEVTHTDLGIEEGIRVMLSAGIATPNVIDKRVSHAHADAQAGGQAKTPPVQDSPEGAR